MDICITPLLVNVLKPLFNANMWDVAVAEQTDGDAFILIQFIAGSI